MIQKENIVKKKVEVLKGIDLVKSIETGMNPATDNERSKKQITKELY